MRLFLITIVLFVAGLGAASAQIPEYGDYGALEFKFTNYVSGNDVTDVDNIEYGSFHLMLGGRSVWALNKKVGLGFGGYLTVNHLDQFISDPDDGDIHYAFQTAYLGPFAEIVILQEKQFMLNGTLLIGPGAGYLVSKFIQPDDDPKYDDIDNGIYFAIQPGISADFYTSKKFAVSAGLSYRLAVGTDMDFIEDEDLSALSFNISLKFGEF